MKIKSILSAMLCAAATAAFCQDSISFMPHYRKGDVDNYHMTMVMSGQMAMTMKMEMVQRVVKVYPNGDADLSVTSSMRMNGQPSPMGSKAPMTMRVNKYGQPVKGAAASAMGQMGFDPTSMASVMPHRPVRAGEVIKINQQMKKGFGVTGTMRVASISGGVAKLVMNEQITTPQTGSMHMVMTATMGTTDSKLRRLEGDMTGIMGSPSGKAHITMTRS